MTAGDKSFLGDINNDGRITDFDAQIALQAVIGGIVLNEEETIRADVNQDGSLSLVDAKAILKHISGETLIDEVIE